MIGIWKTVMRQKWKTPDKSHLARKSVTCDYYITEMRRGSSPLITCPIFTRFEERTEIVNTYYGGSYLEIIQRKISTRIERMWSEIFRVAHGRPMKKMNKRERLNTIMIPSNHRDTLTLQPVIVQNDLNSSRKRRKTWIMFAGHRILWTMKRRYIAIHFLFELGSRSIGWCFIEKVSWCV